MIRVICEKFAVKALDFSTISYYNISRAIRNRTERSRIMDENYKLLRKIMLATNKIDGAYYSFARKHNQNENTLAFIYALSDRKPHSQKEISEEWVIPKTTINYIVKSMLADGYIEFISGVKAREKAIVLTDSGRDYVDKILADIYDAENEAISEVLKKYPPEFADAIDELADRLLQTLTESNKGDKT